MTRRTIKAIDPETGAETDMILATVTRASPDVVRTVIAARMNEDGRSAYFWLTLQNGDRVLGVFPHGDTYEATKTDGEDAT